MIRHFFLLTWSNRKRHLPVLIQLFFIYLLSSFLVLASFNFGIIGAPPQRFNIDNLATLYLRVRGDSIVTLAKHDLQGLQEIRSVSITSFIPYASISEEDKLTYLDKSFTIEKSYADEDFLSTAGLSLVSGRWFKPADRAGNDTPAVINTTIKNKLFGEASVIGKTVHLDKGTVKIVGIIADLNDPTDSFQGYQLFLLNNKTSATSLILKLKRPLDDSLDKKIKASLAHVKNALPVLNPISITQFREDYETRTYSPLLILIGITVFLVINAILGLFSILYQNINRRKPEIGVRRAAGATSVQICMQVLSEVLILATLAILPGIVVALQFALFQFMPVKATVQYYYAMGSAAAIIYILVSTCALYPALLAAKTRPAEALHEE